MYAIKINYLYYMFLYYYSAKFSYEVKNRSEFDIFMYQYLNLLKNKLISLLNKFQLK